MGALTNMTPSFATEMAKIQLDAQLGKEPDPGKVRELAGEMDKAYTQWEVLVTKLRNSEDFQSREYYMLTQCHLKRQNKSFDQVGLMVKFQIDCMQAFASGSPPPMPPLGLDLSMPEEGGPSPAAAMGAAEITAEPFTGRESLFESDVVREEYGALCRDHQQLIKMGETYGTFDPLGKIAFLDQLERVEDDDDGERRRETERWDIFYGRCSLQGGLNPDFREQCEAYLASLGLPRGEFRNLLSKAHKALRKEAEVERGLA